MMPVLDDKRLVDFIHKERDENNQPFTKIAEKLEKMGHVSKNTGEPISHMTVRYYYYNAKPGNQKTRAARDAATALAPQQQDNTVSLVRAALKMDVPDAQKLKLIASIIEG